MSPYVSSQFGWYDWLTFGVVIAMSFAIGIYHAVAGLRNSTTSEYFTGSRQLKLGPVTLSIFMSYISGITVLGNSAEFYTFGAQQWITNVLGMTIGYTLTALVMVPLFYDLKIYSSFELGAGGRFVIKYLERRFNSVVIKRIATVLAVIFMILYMAVAMYSPAIALNAVSPIPTWASIIVTGVVTTIYTSIGGMKAVIWTDVFQGIVLLLGIIAIIIIGSVKMGGIGDAWEAASEMGRTQFFDFSPDPLMRMNFWSILAGAISSGLQHGVTQTSVQRYIALPTKVQAMCSIVLAIPLYALLWTLTWLLGVLIFGYYHIAGCDSLRTGVIYSPNQLASYYALNALEVPVLPGIFVSVLFCGALSSVSSSLNASSAVIWKDFLSVRFNHISEFHKTLTSKVITFIVGAVSVGVAFLVERLPGHVAQVTSILLGTLGAPLTGFFFLAAFFPFANIPGLIAGCVVSLGMGCALTVGGYIYTPYIQMLDTTVEGCADLGFNVTFPIPTDPLSFLVYYAIASWSGIVAGALVSLFTGYRDPRTVDPKLIIPIFDVLCCYFPKS